MSESYNRDPGEATPRFYVGVRLQPDDYASLTELAREDRRGRGQYMEILLLKHLREVRQKEKERAEQIRREVVLEFEQAAIAAAKTKKKESAA